MRLTFAGDKATLKGDGPQASTATVILDATRKPPAIDINLDDGKPLKGVYKLEGDTLTISHGRPGGPRAKEFKSTADNNAALMVEETVQRTRAPGRSCACSTWRPPTPRPVGRPGAAGPGGGGAVKPTVGADSHGAWRTSLASAGADQARLALQLASGDTLVQPYIPEVASRGE
jgi:hypothetical protein